MSMIERVARAMYERMEGRRSHILGKWENLDPAVRAHYREGAGAAIEAMREPTQEMIKAIDATEDAECCLHERHGYEVSWPVMIDAALAEMIPIYGATEPGRE